MSRIGKGLVVIGALFALAAPAGAAVNIDIGLPRVNIRLNLPLYPDLALVPGLPVYYAPRLEANYFFYDGYYWVYLDDGWYASDWYNGPWWPVDPAFVPLFILRIPILYYRQPPLYFYDWPRQRPPHWGSRWGHDWERNHRGWDRWDHRAAPPPAPLPDYQRNYPHKRYPHEHERQQLQQEHYRYQPHERAVREHFEPGWQQKAPPAQKGGEIRTPPRNDRSYEQPRNRSRSEGGWSRPEVQRPQRQQQERQPALHGQSRRRAETQQSQPSQRPQGNERRAPTQKDKASGWQGNDREGRGKD